jgi:hypothetical protein
MGQDQFYISFKRSGGFTGASSSLEIDSRDLDSMQTEDLKILIEGSGFFEAFAFDNSLLQMPDQFRYQISIEYEGRKRTLEMNDTSVPDLFRPLINHLVYLARTGRRG